MAVCCNLGDRSDIATLLKKNEESYKIERLVR